MILELTQLLWLQTPHGKATVKFLIDYGPEADLMWVCVQEDGSIWTWSNWQVRALPNMTLDRKQSYEDFKKDILDDL